MSAELEAPASASRFVRLYGDRPVHLIALLGCFALTGYTVLRIINDPALTRIAVWFVGAAVVWDLVVGPAFALADRALRPLQRLGGAGRGGLRLLNAVRVPAVFSALLFMVWAPQILQRSQGVFRTKTGLSQEAYLGRWLGVTAALFAGSAVVWLIGTLRARRQVG